jgi:hypothetical protein
VRPAAPADPAADENAKTKQSEAARDDDDGMHSASSRVVACKKQYRGSGISPLGGSPAPFGV